MSEPNEPARFLDEVVPFGRLFDEYRLMFGLDDRDRVGRILGVGDGPASFNAEATAGGWNVTSIDPLYAFGADEIRARFDSVVEGIIARVAETLDEWVWTYHSGPEQLRERRVQAIDAFSADLDRGRRAGRYVTGRLPELPFRDGSFDLALSSHVLFLYSDLLDADFHRSSVFEMLRIAPEVRIFPLLEMDQSRSRHLDAVIEAVERAGFRARIREVDYGIQPGGNYQLVITREPPSGA